MKEGSRSPPPRWSASRSDWCTPPAAARSAPTTAPARSSGARDRSRCSKSAGAAIARRGRAIGVAHPKQVLFGDLHVHTTFSFDAFTFSLPMLGGEGAHPPADACDFARYCSSLDFWSINDHDFSITPRHWRETVDSIRQCNEVAGDPANPDMVAYLGWEWTQVGTTPEKHYGHKNVVLEHLDDARIPARPISALAGLEGGSPSRVRARLAGAARRRAHPRPRALFRRARRGAGVRSGREHARSAARLPRAGARRRRSCSASSTNGATTRS